MSKKTYWVIKNLHDEYLSDFALEGLNGSVHNIRSEYDELDPQVHYAREYMTDRTDAIQFYDSTSAHLVCKLVAALGGNDSEFDDQLAVFKVTVKK